MNSIPIIIPAYEPDNRMIDLIRHIRSDYDGDIIIVNDGSDASFDTLYEQAAEYGCTILRHDTNSGKGRALKTAFHYCLTRFPDLTGCITADSDGQHTAEDILRCMDTLQEHPDKLILGCRNFRGADVPRKSRFGNLMTCHACRLLCGLNISDTQTGLRGIPAPFMQELLSVRGERFEFETRMLIASKQRYDILEFPIRAVYDSKNNHQTHFDPLRDSLRIYRIFGEVFLRFFLSSVTSCGVLNPVSVDPHQTILKQIHPGNLILHFVGIRNPEGFPVYPEKISLIPHRCLIISKRIDFLLCIAKELLHCVPYIHCLFNLTAYIDQKHFVIQTDHIVPTVKCKDLFFLLISVKSGIQKQILNWPPSDITEFYEMGSVF